MFPGAVTWNNYQGLGLQANAALLRAKGRLTLAPGSVGVYRFL